MPLWLMAFPTGQTQFYSRGQCRVPTGYEDRQDLSVERLHRKWNDCHLLMHFAAALRAIAPGGSVDNGRR